MIREEIEEQAREIARNYSPESLEVIRNYLDELGEETDNDLLVSIADVLTSLE